jgi:hypothetical protein
MADYVGGVKLTPLSAEFIAELEKAFPPPRIEPGFDRDKELWAAACNYVVQWVKTKANTQAVTQNDPVARQLAQVRMGS